MVVYRALPPATLGPSFCFFEHPSSFPPQGLNTCWSLCLEPIHPNVHRTDSLSFIFQPNEMSSKSLRWAPSLSRTPLLSTMSFPNTSLCHALLILINNMWKWVSDLVVCLQMIQYVVFDSFFFLAVLHGIWKLSSLTRDWIHSPCIGSAESEPLDCQGSPKDECFLKRWMRLLLLLLSRFSCVRLCETP